MAIALFDVQCGFGSVAPGQRELLTAEALLAEMEHVQVERALVRMAPALLEIDLLQSNRHLYAHCEAHLQLIPCPIVAPNSARDLAAEEAQVDDAIVHGAGAVYIRPHMDYWTLAPWGCDRLFQALEARRLPVLCHSSEVAQEEVAELAGRYPALPLIFAGADYRSQRILLPLLEAFPNFYLSLGSNYLVHRGIEQCVTIVGAERLLFGSGFPEVDMSAHVAQLLYADISEKEKILIGAGNLDRLIGEVVR